MDQINMYRTLSRKHKIIIYIIIKYFLLNNLQTTSRTVTRSAIFLLNSIYDLYPLDYIT